MNGRLWFSRRVGLTPIYEMKPVYETKQKKTHSLTPDQPWPYDDVSNSIQVYWWPQDFACNDSFERKDVVLVGEAVCPPASSLRPVLHPHRLPIYQLNRRTPLGIASFETLHEKMTDYMGTAFDGKQHGLEVNAVDVLTPRPPTVPRAPRGHRPVPIAAVRSQISGPPCCLDVDLAFLGPSDPRAGLREGDGNISFLLRSLRVPPLDHGYVSVKVCEAVLQDGGEVNYEAFDGAATQNGAALERELLRKTVPSISQTRALWSSNTVMLGSWGGSSGAPRCTAVWARNAPSSVWIAPKEEMLRAVEGNTLPQIARHQALFQKVSPLIVPVTNQWSPMKLEMGDPLPRSWERFCEAYDS